MERNKRENRSLIIISIIILLASSVLTYFVINKYQILIELNKDNNKLTEEIDKYKNEYDNNIQVQNKLKEEENSLNNISENIANLKKEVFSLASKLEQKIINGESNTKIAYITFDDGPYHSTLKVLDILDKYKVKATFFTIGLDKDICYDNKEYSCAETYKLEVDKGHTIANHTYSHSIFKGLYSSADSFINDIKKQEQLILDRTGYKTNIIRFPGGSSTSNALLGPSGTNSIKESLREMGYGWVDWTAQDGDGGYVPNTTVAWNNFIGSINEDIEVILFHDYSDVTIAILPEAIEYLENNNYIILPLFYDSIKVNK